MSDGRTTGGGSSSGFIGDEPQRLPYALAGTRRETDRPLKGQVRQEAREVNSSRKVWNTYCFLLDAHKPTGQRHVSAQPRASSVLLGGRRTHTTHTNEYNQQNGGRIDA